MKYIELLREYFNKYYSKLPLNVRRVLSFLREPFAFLLSAFALILSYYLLFRLADIIITGSMFWLGFAMFTLTVVSGVLAVFIKKHIAKTLAITMAVCALAINIYNFSTVVDRLGFIEIAEIEDFALVNKFKSGNFVLMGDINFTEDDEVYIPRFSGTIDGCGYSINGLKLDNKPLIANNSGNVSGINFNDLSITVNGSDCALITNNSGELSDITVNNLKIKATDAENVGLVSKSENVLTNLVITSAEINAKNCTNVGLLAGKASGSKNCYAYGKMNAKCNDSANIGGLIGKTFSDKINIQMSSSDVEMQVSVTDKSFIGGLVGNVIGDIELTESAALGSINITNKGKKSVAYAGGLTGAVNEIKYKNCASDCEISIVSEGEIYAGGLIGLCNYGDKIKLTDGYFSGKMHVESGKAFVGGLIGECDSISAKKSSANISGYFVNFDASTTKGADAKFNCGFGKIDTKSFDFVKSCVYSDKLSVSNEQGFVKNDSRSIDSRTNCLINLNWESKVWSFAEGYPMLKNVRYFSDANAEQEDVIKAEVYANKTLSVYPDELLEKYKTSSVVCSTTVNIRKGPGTSYGKITELSNNTEILIVAEQNGWSLVRFNNNNYGWIINTYVD